MTNNRHVSPEPNNRHVSPEPEPAHSLAPPDAQVVSVRWTWKRLGRSIGSITPGDTVRLLLVCVLLGGIVWLLQATWGVLLPFQVGAVLAYVLLPMVTYLERWVPRRVAVLVVCAGLVGVCVIGLKFLLMPLMEQGADLWYSLASAEALAAFEEDLHRILRNLPPDVQNLLITAFSQTYTSIRDNLEYSATAHIALVSVRLTYLLETFSFLVGFLVVPFWLYDVLKDAPVARRAADQMLPTWLRADFWAVLMIIDRACRRYVYAHLLLGLVTGGAVYFGLTMLELVGTSGIRWKLALAVIAGTAELIPLVGAIIGALPAVLLGMLSSWQTMLALIGLYFLIQQLEHSLLIPRVIGESSEIPAPLLLIVLAALGYFGIFWAILAAPLVVAVRDLFTYIYGRLGDPPHPVGVLPGVFPLPAQAPSLPSSPAQSNVSTSEIVTEITDRSEVSSDAHRETT